MTFGISTATAIAVGTAAVSAGTAMYGQAQQNKANMQGVTAANNDAYRGYISSVSATMENNRAIGEANTTNMIRTGYKVGLLNLQTARLKELAATQGWQISGKAADMMSNAEAIQAASGTVGSSVSAVANDIRKKSAEAQIAVDENWRDTLENQNFQLNAIVTAGRDSLQSTQDIMDVNGINTRTHTGGSVFGAGLAAAGSSAINSYASSQLNLGKAPKT